MPVTPLPNTGEFVSALPVATSPDAIDLTGVQAGVTKKLSSTLLATQAELDAHAHTGTYERLPPSADAVVYVSKGASANDANDGLTPYSAKATLAAARTAIAALGGGTIKLGYGVFTDSATYTPVANSVTRGVGRIATTISYTGTGTAVNFAAGSNFATMEKLEVKVTSLAATVRGVVFQPNAYDNVFDGLVTGPGVATAGQIGVLFQGSDAAGCYWNRLINPTVRLWDRAVDFDSTGSVGNANANTIIGGRIGDSNVCLRFGKAVENIVSGTHLDAFASGIGVQMASGAQGNVLQFRAEGGTNSRSYQLEAGSNNNVLVLYDNSPLASTDAGTNNIVMANGILRIPELRAVVAKTATVDLARSLTKSSVAAGGTAALDLAFDVAGITGVGVGWARVMVIPRYAAAGQLQAHYVIENVTVNTGVVGGTSAVVALHNGSTGNFVTTTADVVVTRPSAGVVRVTFTNANGGAQPDDVTFVVLNAVNLTSAVVT